MITETFEIRPMRRADLDLALDWAAAEGWNPGIYDAECFYQTDQSGFWMGELHGEPIGCISAVAYDQQFGFIGMYIVKPEFRGQGFGLQLWKKAMNHLGPERNIGLDGVIAQQENYKKSGFQIAYRHIRYQRLGGNLAASGTVKLSEVPFEQLLAYDRRVFPAQRATFLQCWIQQPGSTALGVVKNQQLVGYAMLRVCRTGFKIGPLFADDQGIAEQLFQALLSEASDAPVLLDTPDHNLAAITLAENYGMKPVFETARMYTKAMPDLPTNLVYGVTTLELG